MDFLDLSKNEDIKYNPKNYLLPHFFSCSPNSKPTLNKEFDEIKKRVMNRIPPSIKSKTEFYILFNSGFFGNKVDTAKTYEEIIMKCWRGNCSIRSSSSGSLRSLVYNFPIEKVPEELKKRMELGFDLNKISFSKTPQDDKLIFQGEIMRTHEGIFFLYSTVTKPMNLALKEEEKIISGLSAVNILKEKLYPVCYDELMELLDLFPNDIIEFSCYDTDVGNLPNRNMIVWEVRGY